LLRYVLVLPKLVGELETELLDQGIAETGFLNFIAGKAIDENASSAFLIEFFQGTDFEQMVYSAQAELEEQRLPIETMEAEFQNVHVALRINRMNQEIEELKAKVNADPRLGQRLNVLVKELGALKSRRASPSP
jgi:DNA primase DnaG-like protein